MAVRNFISRSLQCLMTRLCVFLKAFCSRKRMIPTRTSSSQEIFTETDIDNEPLEAGGTTNMKNLSDNRDGDTTCDISEEDLANLQRKGVFFFSTPTILEGNTPVVLPWHAVANVYDGTVLEKVSASSTAAPGQSISQAISSCRRDTYDDSSMFGLSFLFASESDRYEVDESNGDLIHQDFQESSLANDLPVPWVEPVDAKWRTDVATAMSAFRSCRVDHDDIVTFPVHLKGDDVSHQVSKDLDELQQIERWRNDVLEIDPDLASPSDSDDGAISRFRFP